jgi:hypothetical protein
MFRRRRINPDSSDASAISMRSRVVDAVWAAQDRFRIGLGEALRTIAEIVRWPIERVAWALRRGVVWPIEDRAGNLSAPVRALSYGLVLLLAAGAGVAGLIWAAPDGHNGPAATQAAATSPIAAAAPETAAAAEPTLHGASPVFKPAPASKPSGLDAAQAIGTDAPESSSSAAATTDKISSSASSSSAEGTAQDNGPDGPPAGPAAISVARDFAGAFVLYETGDDDAGVRKAFGETATPELARALLRRPPRLPAGVEVPEAKVVNIVSAPSHGDVYPVSVSLLRVGLTSELRLELEQLKGDRWLVTNVLG